MSRESPIVEEIRERCLRISEEFGHDLRKYAEHLKEVESKYPERLVNQITVVKASDNSNKTKP